MHFVPGVNTGFFNWLHKLLQVSWRSGSIIATSIKIAPASRPHVIIILTLVVPVEILPRALISISCLSPLLRL